MKLSNNNSRKSISLIEEYEVNIPNKLKKYLNEKPLTKSYIRKLSILLNSNDKYYRYKRPILKQLSSAFDEKNKEYLSVAKYKSHFNNREEFEESSSSSREIIINKKNISDFHIRNIKLNKNDFFVKIPGFLNKNFEYYRTPQVIINNEKLMFDAFKSKKILIKKIPYLSRNRNDLIIFDKKTKNNNKMLENLNNNNYLENFLQKQKIKKFHIKKIYTNSKNKYDKNKIEIPNVNIIRTNLLLPFIQNNSKSMILEKNDKNNYILSHQENKLYKNNLLKYQRLKKSNLISK